MPVIPIPPMNGYGPPQGMLQNQGRILDPSTGQPFARDGMGFPGDGYAIPHVYQQVGILSGAQQTYFHDRWDEARRNSRQNALAMERDVFLQGILQERKLATSGLTWHVEVDDEKDVYQKSLKDGLQRILRDTPYLQRHHYAALDAIWYGRHGVQHRYVWRDLDLPSVKFQPAVPGVGSSADDGAGDGSGTPSKPTAFSRSRATSRASQQQRYFGEDRLSSGRSNIPLDEDAAGLPAADTDGVAARGAPAALTRTTQRRRCWIVQKHQPVHGDSIGHKWDGTPYILIYAAKAHELAEQGAEVFDANDPKQQALPPGEITLTTGGSYGLVLRDAYWRDRFIIHSHISLASEFFEVERAEAIHGVGVRDTLYWFWWLGNEWLEWVVTYYERVGLGISLWFYEAGNDRSYNEVFRLAEQQSRRANILVPWYTDKRGGGAGGLERIETPVQGATALIELRKYFAEQAERFLIGQKLSSDHRGSGGLGGSGAAEFQQDTKNQIIKFDAENLGGTYTQDWLEPVKRNTFPEWADIPARFVFNIPDPAGPEKLEAVTKAYSMGIEFIKDEVRSLTGMSDPQPGDDMIGQPAQQLDPETGKPIQQEGGDEGDKGGSDGDKNSDNAKPTPFARSHYVRPDEIVHFAPQGPEAGLERYSSYFSECPRDEGGHCLPSGSASMAQEHLRQQLQETRKVRGKERASTLKRIREQALDEVKQHWHKHLSAQYPTALEKARDQLKLSATETQALAEAHKGLLEDGVRASTRWLPSLFREVQNAGLQAEDIDRALAQNGLNAPSASVLDYAFDEALGEIEQERDDAFWERFDDTHEPSDEQIADHRQTTKNLLEQIHAIVAKELGLE